MKRRSKRTRCVTEETMCPSWIINFSIAVLGVLFSTAFYLVVSFTPLNKEEQVAKFNEMNQNVEPFRRNLSECARQVKASTADVEHFLKRIPQQSMQGKCFVACMLKRNSIIKNNKISAETLLEANRQVYGEDGDLMERLSKAVTECTKAIDGIFEICEFASVFNDCMHINMEHILDKVTMERRMEALGQMTKNPDEWTDEEEELLRLAKDEL